MEEVMLTKHLRLASLGTALLVTPVLAQTQTTSPTSGPLMIQMQPGQWRLSSFEGLNVYDEANEKIGDIKELIFRRDGQVAAAVIGVVGFLGVDEHSVAVPFDQIRFMDQPHATAANTGSNPAPSTGMSAPQEELLPQGLPRSPRPARRPQRAECHAVGPDHAVLNMTRDQLKAAPECKTR
jgi:sporulation protein YlmC with PRC-barrel domain